VENRQEALRDLAKLLARWLVEDAERSQTERDSRVVAIKPRKNKQNHDHAARS
jgi:hypothetical protein